MASKKKLETLAERLIRIRESKSLNRIELAAAAGVSQGAIQLIERGVTRKPSAPVLERLAKVLGLTAAELLFGWTGDEARR